MKLLSDIKKNVDIDIRVLDEEEKMLLKQLIKQKYTANKYSNFFLWEYFNDFQSVQDKDGWKYIRSYVGDSKCIVFFRESDERAFIELNSGTDLNTMIGEMYGFEFYVTDSEASYLMCFNDHDILYGLGNAKEYVEKLAE